MSTKPLTAKFMVRLHLFLFLLLVLPGCLATRSWVSQQLKPVDTRMTSVEQRVSETETWLKGSDPLLAKLVSEQIQPMGKRVTSVEQRVSGVENRLTSSESEIKKIDSKTDKAIGEFKNLRIERNLVLDFKDGAFFMPNSDTLLDPARKNIDKFLKSLKPNPTDNHMFYVTGFTDSAGSSNFNYELGRKRADSVGRYLIIKKGIDPTRVMTASGGDKNPAGDNYTAVGREKNRRVEILVYKDSITRVLPEIAATLSRMSLTPRVAPGN